MQDLETLLGRDDLKGMGVGVSNTTLLRWEALGKFPRRIRIGGCRIAWLRSEVDQWLAQCAQDRANTHYAEY